MRLIPIQVEAAADESGQDSPRRFCWASAWLDLWEIVDRWHQAPGNPEWPAADYFKVLASDLRQYLLKHDLESGEWFCLRQW